MHFNQNLREIKMFVGVFESIKLRFIYMFASIRKTCGLRGRGPDEGILPHQPHTSSHCICNQCGNVKSFISMVDASLMTTTYL